MLHTKNKWKVSDKIFWLRSEYRDSVFTAAIIACVLTLGNQCKHLLSQLTLRQSGVWDTHESPDWHEFGRGFNCISVSKWRRNTSL